MIQTTKRGFHFLLRRVGYDIVPTAHDPYCEGFDTYLHLARKVGADVNDWIENELGWEPALPILEKVLFPHLQNDMIVCEMGPGTGRCARHIIEKVDRGTIHLFDHSKWIQNFLREYFATKPNVTVHNYDGLTINSQPNFADIVFANGVFIELKLGFIFFLANEFLRILKPDGYVIFDYIDISTREGWEHLISQSPRLRNVFTYHCADTIERIFAHSGFQLVGRTQIGKSTYVTFQKSM